MFLGTLGPMSFPFISQPRSTDLNSLLLAVDEKVQIQIERRIFTFQGPVSHNLSFSLWASDTHSLNPSTSRGGQNFIKQQQNNKIVWKGVMTRRGVDYIDYTEVSEDEGGTGRGVVVRHATFREVPDNTPKVTEIIGPYNWITGLAGRRKV